MAAETGCLAWGYYANTQSYGGVNGGQAELLPRFCHGEERVAI